MTSWADNMDFRINGSIPIRWFQRKLHLPNTPGAALNAVLTATAANITFKNGCAASTLTTAQALNLITPNSQFGPRFNQLDLAINKSLDIGWGKLRLAFDLYNAQQQPVQNVTTAYSLTASANRWQRPTTFLDRAWRVSRQRSSSNRHVPGEASSSLGPIGSARSNRRRASSMSRESSGESACKRLLVMAPGRDHRSASVAFAGDSIPHVGTRHAQALAAPRRRRRLRQRRTLGCPQQRRIQGGGSKFPSKMAASVRKGDDHIGLAVGFAASAWTIDHHVLDVTPSSLGTRKD